MSRCDPASGHSRGAPAARLYCAIGGAVVDVRLRHGRGVPEHGHVYVSCSERDCQYVDLNEPPCPLRAHMFAGDGDAAVRAALVGSAGAALCYGCLIEAAAMPHERVRYAVWLLADEPDWNVDVRPRRCSRCRERRSTVRATGPTREGGEAPHGTPTCDRALGRSLLGAGMPAVCAGCLALATHRSLDDAQRTMETLRRDGRFTHGHGPCSRCGRDQELIASASRDGRQRARVA